MSLHERVAKALGWTVEQAQSFSLLTLRELLQHVSPKLAAEIAQAVQSGSYVT